MPTPITPPAWVREKCDRSEGRTHFSLMAWDVNSPRPEAELFVSFSEGKSAYPIERTGISSPRMFQAPPWEEYASDPEVHWVDSWFITEESKRAEIVWSLAQLAAVRLRLDPNVFRAFWRDCLDELPEASPIRSPEFTRFLRGIDGRLLDNGRVVFIADWGQPSDVLAGYALPLRNGEQFPLSISVVSLCGPAREQSNRELREVRKWGLLLDSHLNCPAHTLRFRECRGQTILGHQGCGDLGLNYWHSAYIGSPIDPSLSPYTVMLPRQPADDHVYPCLVRWKSRHGGEQRAVEVCDLRFPRVYANAPPNHMVQSRVWGETWRWEDVGDRLHFAVAGKPIIRDGKPIPLSETIHLYADLRHVFELPNLNPAVSTQPESFRDRLQARPRQIFAELQWDDVWLGEAALLGDEHLRRAALTGPVRFSARDLGTYPEHIRSALEWEPGTHARHYEEVDRRPERPGQYRVVRGNGETSFDIWFRRNTYPFSVLGIRGDGRLLSCVCQCPYSAPEVGFTIEAISQLLIEVGAESALLFEEGRDPYLSVATHDLASLPIKRAKRPAVFLLAHPHSPHPELN